MKIKIFPYEFLLTKENAGALYSLFELVGYDSDKVEYLWIRSHLQDMLKYKGLSYTIYCSPIIIKRIDEYINDNNIRYKGTRGSNSSIPE